MTDLSIICNKIIPYLTDLNTIKSMLLVSKYINKQTHLRIKRILSGIGPLKLDFIQYFVNLKICHLGICLIQDSDWKRLPSKLKFSNFCTKDSLCDNYILTGNVDFDWIQDLPTRTYYYYIGTNIYLIRTE